MKQRIKNYWPLIVPISVIIIAVFFWMGRSPEEKLLIGMVEADYVDVASEIPGRLQARYVEVGDSVRKGQVIARMSPKEVEAITGQSQAAVNAAEAQLKMMKEGAREEEKEAAKNVYLITKDQYELAEKTWNRMDALYKDSVISGEEHDLAEFNYKAAEKEMLAAKSKYNLLVNGARPEAIKAAEALVDQAKNAHSFTSTLGENLEVIAPANGLVSSIAIQEGEVVMVGFPMATIQKEGTLHIVLQIRQDQISEIEVGSILKGTIPGATDGYVDFVVKRRNVMMDYADWIPTNEKGSFDLKSFEIVLEPSQTIENILPGMTVAFKQP